MEININILFQDIDGRILADGCQLLPNRYSEYCEHIGSRFICLRDNHNYFYKDINDKMSKVYVCKPLPILYKDKKECCGCGACYSICPRTDTKKVVRKDENGSDIVFSYQVTHNGKIIEYPHTGAITMLPDEDGFLYPVVDAEICIRCQKCMSVCDFKMR